MGDPVLAQVHAYLYSSRRNNELRTSPPGAELPLIIHEPFSFLSYVMYVIEQGLIKILPPEQRLRDYPFVGEWKTAIMHHALIYAAVRYQRRKAGTLVPSDPMLRVIFDQLLDGPVADLEKKDPRVGAVVSEALESLITGCKPEDWEGGRTI
jgi:hypothetical protein